MPYKDKKKEEEYQAEYRKTHRKKSRRYSKKYYRDNKEKAKIHNAAYHKAHKKEENARRRRHHHNNKTKSLKTQRNWRKRSVERITIVSHYYAIFSTKSFKHKNYKGMPFFDEWNPDKGGSFDVGAEWIIKNLGKRPKGSTMHIIDHALGFVPGNLEWTHPRKQAHQQMCKIIAQQRNRIKKLEARIKELEAQIV